MSRHLLSLSDEQRTAFDLEACVTHAEVLKQRPRATVPTPFPQDPRRWLSHDRFTPRPLPLTQEGDVAGGRRWLVGATMDFGFTRALCAPPYGPRGGPCDDPASLVFLDIAAPVDRSPDSARFWADLPQPDKGRHSRELAGLHDAVPGEDALCHFRHRGGAEAIEETMAVVVALFRTFGLIQGALLSPDGPRAPAFSRDQGCPSACQDCQQLRLDEAHQQALARQLPSGAKRRQRPCPFPAVVAKVRQATGTTGTPTEPQGARREMEVVPQDPASPQDRPQVATRRGRPEDQGPELRLQGCRRRQHPQGERFARCPKVPSDLDAKVGDPIDTPDPAKTERVFGYRHQKTTEITRDLGLELPLGTTPSPAHADEGPHFMDHREALALPVLSGQGQRGDAASDVTANDRWMREQGGLPGIDDHPRREDLSAAARQERGDDQHGTPAAPCGRRWRSHGDDAHANARQSVGGTPCSATEPKRCPQGSGVRGYRRRMTFPEPPRLIGPMQRGRPAWQRLYAARTASERTHSDAQEVIGGGRPPRRRGLHALRFAGAIRTWAQRRRRALHVVLDVTYPLNRRQLFQTCTAGVL